MKKALNIAKTVLVWAVVALAVFMMVFTILSTTVFDNSQRSLFGYQFYIVRSDSMSATHFKAGDLVISKEVDESTLVEGDVITFVSQNSESYMETVTHMIRKKTTNDKGEPAFITYGTTTGTDDETLVTYEFVLGEYQGKLPGVGTFFMFLKTTPGYLICILLPFLLLILSQGINAIRLFRQYKSEQMDAMKAEREKLEQERLESQRMMAELLALKQQLANNATVTAAAPVARVAQPAPQVAPAAPAAQSAPAVPAVQPAPQAAPEVSAVPTVEAAPAPETEAPTEPGSTNE